MNDVNQPNPAELPPDNTYSIYFIYFRKRLRLCRCLPISVLSVNRVGSVDRFTPGLMPSCAAGRKLGGNFCSNRTQRKWFSLNLPPNLSVMYIWCEWEQGRVELIMMCTNPAEIWCPVHVLLKNTNSSLTESDTLHVLSFIQLAAPVKVPAWPWAELKV